ncbi:MAG TPA: helix-turn-helix domain-containing protein, partial [Thermoanaerobaculia bacterium]|nr:helix-turn-helix domain-containing protein [Thermoanaerobaculia bacterium]
MKREDVERMLRGTFAMASRTGDADGLKSVVAPKQARSRDTLHRLLNAAEELLAEGGLDAATVPAIAERAEVSVGVVYRRFPDKDALLRAVYERFFWRVKEQNNIGLATFATIKLPLPELVRGMVRGMVEGYRRKRNILRALLEYSRTHPDAKFKRTARELNRASTG